MLVTVCVFKKGLHRYAWIPIVPLVWDVAVTFTADFQKIFDSKLGYFAAAAKYREQIASGTSRVRHWRTRVRRCRTPTSMERFPCSSSS